MRSRPARLLLIVGCGGAACLAAIAYVELFPQLSATVALRLIELKVLVFDLQRRSRDST